VFVTICKYRAKIGEEDAIVALHEDRENNRQLKAKGYLSGELLEVIDDRRTFIDIARFDSETSARSVMEDPEQISWQRRLASLMEMPPTFTNCQAVWHTSQGAPTHDIPRG